METISNVELLKVSSKPYDFVGKNNEQVKGTSYKATLLAPSGDIFVLKTDESTYKDVEKAEMPLKVKATINITENEYDKKINLYLVKVEY